MKIVRARANKIISGDFKSFTNVHVDYNPLKGMLVLISSLRLSILSYATGPES
jgi:hypothetical protein